MAIDTTVLDTATFAIKKRIRMAIFLVLPSVADLKQQITSCSRSSGKYWAS